MRMSVLVAVLYCSPARQLGNAARMEKRANWFRSVSRMLIIGAVGLPPALQFLLKSHNMTTDVSAVLLAVFIATPAAFLSTGAFYFVAAVFWLARALHAPPTADESDRPAEPTRPTVTASTAALAVLVSPEADGGAKT